MMIREGGGLVVDLYTWDLFAQCQQLPILIEDYPYAGMDYRGYTKMP